MTSSDGSTPPRRGPYGSQPVLRVIHRKLLLGLLSTNYLTVDLACRRDYSYPGSLTAVRTGFRELEAYGLVERVFLPREGTTGSAKHVWTLSGKGLSLLAQEGYEVWPRYHAGEARSPTLWALHHHLEAATVLVLAELLCRRVPAFTLARAFPERTLKRHKVLVAAPAGETGSTQTTQVIPDCYVEFRRGDAVMPVAFEVDRSTEGKAAFSRKVRQLAFYAQGPFQQAFGRRSLTIAILATRSPAQADMVKRWTEAELVRLGLQRLADVFQVTHVDLATVEPEPLFLAPRFLRPFDAAPQPLLAQLLEPAP